MSSVTSAQQAFSNEEVTHRLELTCKALEYFAKAHKQSA